MAESSDTNEITEENTLQGFADIDFDGRERYHNADDVVKKRLRENHYGKYCQLFKNNIDDMCEREITRPHLGDVKYGDENSGMCRFWGQVVELYVYGFFHACIAFIGMTAERTCKDLFKSQEISLNGRKLSDSEKDALQRQDFHRLIETLDKLCLIDNGTRKRLDKIRNIRNKYVHGEHKLDEKSDCETLMEELCEVIKSLYSIFNDYDIADGMLVPKKR